MKREVSPEEPEESLTLGPCARQGRMGARGHPCQQPAPSARRAVCEEAVPSSNPGDPSPQLCRAEAGAVCLLLVALGLRTTCLGPPGTAAHSEAPSPRAEGLILHFPG